MLRLDDLIEKVKRSEGLATALTFLAVASLVHKGEQELTLKTLFNEASVIKEKLNIESLKSELATFMSLLRPLGDLQKYGVIEKISENPAKYRVIVDQDTVYKYAGKLLLTLLQLY